MTTTYTVPDNPTDPEAAALELIVRLPGAVADRFADAGLTAVLQDYCGVLQVEGAFAGMTWHDAKAVAAAVSFDCIQRENAAAFIRYRARNVLSGADNNGASTWDDRAAASRALNICAMALGE